VKRFIVAASVITAGLLTPVVTTVPANADNGGPSVGCTSGDSCTIMLEGMVKFNGDVSSGSRQNPVGPIAPPPCLWVPLGDTLAGSQYLITTWGTDPTKWPTTFQINQSVQQAVDFAKQGAAAPAGEWYNLPINPAAGAAGAQACLQLPAYAWVVPGQPLPAVNLPPETLAQLAFAKLTTPAMGALQLNPANRNYTNLPTFVNATLAVGGYHQAADGRPYVAVTASIQGQPSATVWAEASSLTIDPGTSSATVYGSPPSTGCGYFGSTESADPMKASNTGPNQMIDCGVTYRQPGAFTMQASISWVACWAPTGDATAPPPPPAFTDCQANPVPGAAQLQAATQAQPVNVAEIQSINGGA